jgi:hypothetical protein
LLNEQHAILPSKTEAILIGFRRNLFHQRISAADCFITVIASSLKRASDTSSPSGEIRVAASITVESSNTFLATKIVRVTKGVQDIVFVHLLLSVD